MTTLREKRIGIGATVVDHARYAAIGLAEGEFQVKLGMGRRKIRPAGCCGKSNLAALSQVFDEARPVVTDL
jgi:hypothetical protein